MADSEPNPDPDSDVAVVGDLIARDRRSDRPALVDAGRDRTYAYDEFCTTAYKAGNVLRHLGVHEGARVAIEPRAAPQPLLAFLGGALLGATVGFDAAPGTDARAVVASTAREAEFDLPPGSKLCAFGDDPERADTTHWETEVWSENPAFPPTEYDPDSPVLAADGALYGHAGLLVAARDAADALSLAAADRVALRAPLSDPRAVAAGVLAPLSAGAAIHLSADAGSGSAADAGADATAAVVAGGADVDVPALAPSDVSLAPL